MKCELKKQTFRGSQPTPLVTGRGATVPQLFFFDTEYFDRSLIRLIGLFFVRTVVTDVNYNVDGLGAVSE